MQSTNGTVEISDPLRELIRELNQPQTARALKNLAHNAQLLDFLVQSLDGVLRRGEEITDNINESVREISQAANGDGKPGGKLLGKLPKLAQTGKKFADIAASEDFDDLIKPENLKLLKNWSDQLSKPEVNQALEKLLELMPTLIFLVESVEGLIRRGEEITDNINGTLGEFLPKSNGAQGAKIVALMAQVSKVSKPLMKTLPQLAENLPPLIEQSPKLIQTGLKLGEIADSEGVQAFLNSDMLTPELIDLLGETGKVAVETKLEFERHPEKVGLWGLYKKSADDDVQRGLGFLMTLAKNFGRMLKEENSRPALRSTNQQALKD